jgi:hypothetical protein
MPIKRKRMDVRPHPCQFVPPEDVLQVRRSFSLLLVACGTGQDHIADVVPSAESQREKMIDRGSVRIQRVHAKGNPPPTIKAFSFLGGPELYKLFEVLVRPKVRFSHDWRTCRLACTISIGS